MNEVANFFEDLKNAIVVNGIEDGHVTNLPAPDDDSDEDDSDYEIGEGEKSSSGDDVETEDDGGGAPSERLHSFIIGSLKLRKFGFSLFCKHQFIHLKEALLERLSISLLLEVGRANQLLLKMIFDEVMKVRFGWF